MNDARLRARNQRWSEDWRWGLAGCFGLVLLGVVAAGLWSQGVGNDRRRSHEVDSAWQFSRLDVEVAGQAERISLLEQGGSTRAP